jgi:hypothetical protein
MEINLGFFSSFESNDVLKNNNKSFSLVVRLISVCFFKDLKWTLRLERLKREIQRKPVNVISDNTIQMITITDSTKCLNLYNKQVCPSKNEPQQQGTSYLEREREGARERGAGGQEGQQAGILKVRLGLGEIEGTDRETEIQRYRET